ncbi:hypothetical protein KP509_31G000300 [Ceratopteris richardii]|uniref:Pectinesterase n=1 Tax=Ceratopteris richardii TaxID=49495 RepID=A0A8T2QW76_CERRI|nr:hypothetical protein KP509_31G000300 [Ceratopteris richardii]
MARIGKDRSHVSVGRRVRFLILLVLCVSHTYSKETTFQAHSVSAENAVSNPNSPAAVDDDGLPPSISLVCSHTAYPEACLRGFRRESRSALGKASPQKIVSTALKAALAVVRESHAFATFCSRSSGPNALHLLEYQAVEDCIDLMAGTTDQLNQAIASPSPVSGSSVDTDALLNLNVWLSASLSFQATCSDGFQFVSYGKCQTAMLKRQEQVAEALVDSLNIVKKLLTKHNRTIAAPHRHLTDNAARENDGSGHFHGTLDGVSELKFPEWVSYVDQRLMLEGVSPTAVRTVVHNSVMANSKQETRANRVGVDLIVAQDGTGDYVNVSDALKHIPLTATWAPDKARFVVYVKQGVYNETFEVPRELANVTFFGDGIGKTVITGNKNVASGLFNTFRTPTVVISADGFMARDMTFQNTAGPQGYQAVALRASGDHTIFYRCSFEGYQDTLYALASRQFYRDCIIQGTVDFIFGNAIASFQNCRLQVRRPLRGQQNTVTAQARLIDADISGFSFQNCTVEAADELVSSPFPVSSFLGRPWRAYSRTVFLESFIDSVIDPAGWLAWNSSNPFIDTLFYGEFQNRGPGSNITGRVTWPGVHSALPPSNASFFTADNFILGSTWLPFADVGYTSGLGSS